MKKFRVTHYENWYRSQVVEAENEAAALEMCRGVHGGAGFSSPEYIDTADEVAEEE